MEARRGSHLFGGTVDTDDFSANAGPRNTNLNRDQNPDTRPTVEQAVYLLGRSEELVTKELGTDARFGKCPSPILAATIREFKQEAGFDLAGPPTAENTVIRIKDEDAGKITFVYGVIHKVKDVSSLVEHHKGLVADKKIDNYPTDKPVQDSAFANLDVIPLNELNGSFKKTDNTDWFGVLTHLAQASGALADRPAPGASASSIPAAAASSGAGSQPHSPVHGGRTLKPAAAAISEQKE